MAGEIEQDTVYDWEPAVVELEQELSELRAMRTRARQLAATPTLDGAARTQAAAGRYVLGLASIPVEVTL
jgi:hypothetical protein